MLNSIHYKKEHFYWDEQLITYAFNEIELKYPDINSIIINTEINQLSEINKKLRQYIINN